MKIPNIRILGTASLSDTKYVDLVEIDGVTKTQVFKKSSEPNNFALEYEAEGDTLDAIVKENLDV